MPTTMPAGTATSARGGERALDRGSAAERRRGAVHLELGVAMMAVALLRRGR